MKSRYCRFDYRHRNSDGGDNAGEGDGGADPAMWNLFPVAEIGSQFRVVQVGSRFLAP